MNPIKHNSTRSVFGARCVLAALLVFGCVATAPAGEPSLWQIQKVLASKKYVDLTHEFAPGIPRWPVFREKRRKKIYGYERGADPLGSVFSSDLFPHVGKWGTHVDPPVHFIKGLRTVDQIDPKEMILPLVVIDVHEEA